MSSIDSRNFETKTGETINVRTAHVDDAADLIAHAKSILAGDEVNVTTEEEFDLTIEQEREWVQQHIHDPGHIAIVAEDEEQHLIGLLFFESGPRKRLAHRGTIHMSVAETWRSRGVGSVLMQCLIDWANSHPRIEKLCLAVLATNTPAIGLYKKFGFVEEGRRPKEVKIGPGHYVDDILMYRLVGQS